MQMGPEGELDSLAQAMRALQFAWAHGPDKQLMRTIVDALADRPESPLANAVGKALKQELHAYGMI
jgi:hypothetical protein